jgi:adenosylcobinamide kinase/adenosylcobinamide-phosphate guanylyltransferase
MVVLVVGVPDSGKSELAEKLVMDMSGDGKRIYLATMEILDDVGRARVDKHRKQRDGKGFFTIEAPLEVSGAMADVAEIGDATVLLECVSNLVGNVMHSDGESDVVMDVARLCRMAKNVVMVTNSFPGDAEGYDDETREFVRRLDEVNERLRKVADVIYEFDEGEWAKSENT